jgi:hypothetical protein
MRHAPSKWRAHVARRNGRREAAVYLRAAGIAGHVPDTSRIEVASNSGRFTLSGPDRDPVGGLPGAAPGPPSGSIRPTTSTLLSVGICVSFKLSVRLIWKRTVADFRQNFTVTMAPQVVDGRVIVGLSGGEFEVRGRVVAFDAQSGNRSGPSSPYCLTGPEQMQYGAHGSHGRLP